MSTAVTTPSARSDTPTQAHIPAPLIGPAHRPGRSVSSSADSVAHVNRLADEQSPYLLAYRDQPVDWYPWGDEAFAEARRRDVPILLSIGYAACHWCHVMAREVFDDAEVAATMNAAFVNVKVDREERPDVDSIYMDAYQLMSGRGGWPLTMLLDTDGRPFWGATYVPRDRFVEVASALTQAWSQQRAELLANADKVVATLATRADVEPANETPSVDVINTTLRSLSAAFDPEYGGFGTETKFPQPFHLGLILRAFMTSVSDQAKTVITTSLDAMAAGGVHDHIGGGFHRYATDREWLVPHFEKMLSDQALLARLYRQVFSIMGTPGYRDVFGETIEYVLRDLRLPGGGFATAQDADSIGVDGDSHEGAFYTWTPAEVRAALTVSTPETDEASEAADQLINQVLAWFHVDDDGDLEVAGQRVSVPNRIPERSDFGQPPLIPAAKRRLAERRSERPNPNLDDQVVTEWNALMITTLAEAAMTTGNDTWLTAAVECAEFLCRELRDDRGRWRRSWRTAFETEPAVSNMAVSNMAVSNMAVSNMAVSNMAVSSDYAALVEAFISLYEATGHSRWIDEAIATAETMLDWYWDPTNGGLFRTAEDADPLIVRQKDVIDGATASANSVAATGLLKLAGLTSEPRYRNHAERIFQLMGPVIAEFPAGVSNTLLALETFHRGFVEIVISGNRPDLVRLAHLMWRPNQVLAWGEPFDSPLWEGRAWDGEPDDGVAYVCRNGTCDAPVSTVDDFFRALTGQEPPEGLNDVVKPS